MKKMITLISILVLAIFTPAALHASEINVTIDGMRVDFGGHPPIIADDITLIPVRSIFEQLGYDVAWDEDTQTVLLTQGGDYIRFTIGGGSFSTNIIAGAYFGLDTPAQTIGGRTMLPLNLLTAVGYHVDYNRATSTYAIISPPQPQITNVASHITGIEAGGSASFAVLADGSLLGWGIHGLGPDSSVFQNTLPEHLLDGVAYISASYTHRMIIMDDGSLWAWGGNYFGELGDGTNESRQYPVHIMDSIAYVSTGTHNTMAITTDGRLYGWGSNYHGQLGIGTNEDHNSPVHVMDDVAAVSVGWSHIMAVRSDGSLWAWGRNGHGQLGDGTFVWHNSPVHVLDDVAAVYAGSGFSTALQTDGTVWTWGRSLDTTTHADLAMDDMVAVSTTSSHTLALTADGSLWAWGSNLFGQLGNGTLRNPGTPALIITPPGVYAPQHIEEPEEPTVSGIVDIVAFSQLDDRWADQMFGGFTIAEGGCGPTAIAMVASTLGDTHVTPLYVATWGSRYYVTGVGAAHTLFTGANMHNHFGLTYQAISINDDDAILEALRDGAMIITSVQSTTSPNARPGNQGIFNPIGRGGHIAVLHGVTIDNEIFITSPRVDLGGESWPLDTIRHELHSGINIFWTYTAP